MPGMSDAPGPGAGPPSTPPDPQPYVPRVLPEAGNANAGVRVAGFLIGACAATLLGFGLLFAGAAAGDAFAPRSSWVGVLAAGPVSLLAGVLLGRWLWTSKRMKGMAVGFIVLSSLWCLFDVACGFMLKDFRLH
ncbi:MAG: hypothetical protein HMLKMBBP_03986 [Planctomycetes bacterium]|nr:hypothetical protein [Planctomycetota bacterium]